MRPLGVSLTAATLGAVAAFPIAKTTRGDLLRAMAGRWLKKLEVGLQENAPSYLLVLRLILLFPTFVVNLVPTFPGVRLRTYFIGTTAGIIPGSFVCATIGAVALAYLWFVAGPPEPPSAKSRAEP